MKSFDTTYLKGHLTDEQFAECLDGSPLRSDLQAHLGQCEPCRLEMELFQTSVADLSAASLQWSRAQPLPSLRPLVAAQAKRSLVISLQWAVAAMLLVGLGVPAYVPTEGQNHANRLVRAQPAAADSEGESASDTALLQSVNVALAGADPSPLQEYRLEAPGLKNTLQASATTVRAQ